jgi:ADP-ribosylation factor GTPase-activating protein 1
MLRSDSASPASFTSSQQGTPDLAQDAKETYFSSLGQINASRPADLPPSQGGRYQGFGSTPSPQPSQHPFGMSSAAAPSLSELQENPMAALGKGWSLFSAAVVGASRAVSENVIQPGMEKARDPELHASVKGYISGAQKRAEEAAKSANNWSKTQFGVDVGEQVGGVVGAVKERVGGGPAASGYGAIAMEHGTETSALYHDEEDDFFGEFENAAPGQSKLYDQPIEHSKTTATSPTKKDDWDKWDEF